MVCNLLILGRKQFHSDRLLAAQVSRDWQSKPLSLAAKRRVCLAGAGRLTRTGPGEESARNIWVGQLPRSGLPGHLAPLRTARVRYGQMKSKRTDQRNEADLRGVMAESFL